MNVLALSELPAAERSNVIPFPRKRDASLLSGELRVRDEVSAECKRRNLAWPETFDAVQTALGTLVFGMSADRAIAAGKARAASLALGKIKVQTTRIWPDFDPNGPRAA